MLELTSLSVIFVMFHYLYRFNHDECPAKYSFYLSYLARDREQIFNKCLLYLQNTSQKLDKFLGNFEKCVFEESNLPEEATCSLINLSQKTSSSISIISYQDRVNKSWIDTQVHHFCPLSKSKHECSLEYEGDFDLQCFDELTRKGMNENFSLPPHTGNSQMVYLRNEFVLYQFPANIYDNFCKNYKEYVNYSTEETTKVSFFAVDMMVLAKHAHISFDYLIEFISRYNELRPVGKLFDDIYYASIGFPYLISRNKNFSNWASKTYSEFLISLKVDARHLETVRPYQLKFLNGLAVGDSCSQIESCMHYLEHGTFLDERHCSPDLIGEKFESSGVPTGENYSIRKS